MPKSPCLILLTGRLVWSSFLSAGVVVLAAAWHPDDTPCLAYFCLVTIPDTAGPTPDELPVEVTKYNPPFQVIRPDKL